MNTIFLIAACLNIILLFVLSLHIFLKVKEKKEDQRITKGLQLLQHKIAILQDLSDKTDDQVRKLIQHLDHKTSDLKKVSKETQLLINQYETLSVQKSINKNFLNPSSENLNMNDFNQFISALNIQNEKLKLYQPLPILKPNVPQNFEELNQSDSTKVIPVISQENKTVRPFEFKRI